MLRFRHSKARKQERDISGTCPSRAAGDWYDSCISNMGRERCAFVCSPQRDRFFFTLEGGRICSGLHLVIRICVSGLKSRCISPRGDDRCSPLRGGSLLLLSAERHFWLFGFFCSAAIFSLASAISRWFASVAPVRGGTYFSLQRQRKVGKRKPLQTSGVCQDSAVACRS